MTFPLMPLKTWFLREKRALPWRERNDPYAVWISEVMLQQTQVSVVVPYFFKWMERFPDILTLANAPLEDVIKCWEGLGYYSRARNLHEGARYVLANYQGQLPCNALDLKKIKGLGDYTVGAILSFAFHQKAAAVDGNVMRVICRFFGIKDDIAKAKNQKKIRQIVQDLLPEEESWIISEALIELGATVCTKKFQCSKCPLRTGCHAYRQSQQTFFPFKSVKVKTEYLKRMVALISWNDHWLVQKGSKGKVMSDLYEFPYFEIQEEVPINPEKIVQQNLGLEARLIQPLAKEGHSFTRFQVSLFPYVFSSARKIEIPGYQWFKLEELIQFPFSSGHRRIFEKIKTQIC